MSKIILLNGCGSSGKSSISKAIQFLSAELWLTFGVDTFFDMIPPSKRDFYLSFEEGTNERGATMRVTRGPEAKKLFDFMPDFAQLLASAGNNLIIDDVILEEKSLQLYREKLQNFSLYYIGVFCDLQLLQERELLRGDRILGLANDQFDRVHGNGLNSYDFIVDSGSKTPFQAARSILDFIKN